MHKDLLNIYNAALSAGNAALSADGGSDGAQATADNATLAVITNTDKDDRPLTQAALDEQMRYYPDTVVCDANTRLQALAAWMDRDTPETLYSAVFTKDQDVPLRAIITSWVHPNTEIRFVGIHQTLQMWLAAVDEGFDGRFPWMPFIKDTITHAEHRILAEVHVSVKGTAGLIRAPYAWNKLTQSTWADDVALEARETLQGYLSRETGVPKLPNNRIIRSTAKPGQLTLFGPDVLHADARAPMHIAIHEALASQMINSNSPLPGDAAALALLITSVPRGLIIPESEGAQLLARNLDGDFRRVRRVDIDRFWQAMRALICMRLEIPRYGMVPLVSAAYDFGFKRGHFYRVRPAEWIREVSEEDGKHHGYTWTGALSPVGRKRLAGKTSALFRMVTGVEFHLCRLARRYGDGTYEQYALQPARKGGPGPWVTLNYRTLLRIIGDSGVPHPRRTWQNRRVMLKKYGYLDGNTASDTVEFRLDIRGHLRVRATSVLCEAVTKGHMRSVSLREILNLPPAQ